MSAIALHLAAFDGDNDRLNQLLSEGADVNAVTTDNETPLFFAARNGHTETVRHLLKWGADVNKLPIGRQSPLRVAIAGGFTEITSLFLDNGADPNAVTPAKPLSPEDSEEMQKLRLELRKLFSDSEQSDKGTDSEKSVQTRLPTMSGRFHCVCLAIRSGNPETLRLLLDRGYPIEAEPGTDPKLSLLDLCRMVPNGDVMTDILLRAGLNPNVSKQPGITPLGAAIVFGDVAMAKKLIDAGARTDGNIEGIGYLSMAVIQGKIEMANFLVERNIGISDSQLDYHLNDPKFAELKKSILSKRGTLWLEAVEAGDTRAVKDALKNGVQINQMGKWGTPLYTAAKADYQEIVRELLDAGANPNLGNTAGVTPLFIAASKGQTEMCSLLIERGAIVDALTSARTTPLLMAASNQHLDTADLLIAHGAKVDVVIAILLRRPDLENAFWASGTPINFTNESGMTPLHAALSICDLEKAAAYLARGADINASDHNGKTPLATAVSTGKKEVVEFALDNGADPNRGEKRMFHPLGLAITIRNEPILRLLLERGATLETNRSTDSKRSVKFGGVAGERLKDINRPINQLMLLHRSSRATPTTELSESWRDPANLWALIRTLIEFGEDPNTVDFEGKPLLVNLIEYDAPLDLIRFVIGHGAAVMNSEKPRLAPLFVAESKKRSDVVDLLRASGATPSISSPLDQLGNNITDGLVNMLMKVVSSTPIRDRIMASLPKETLTNTTYPEPSVNTTISQKFREIAAKDKEKRASRLIQWRAKLVAEIEQGAGS